MNINPNAMAFLVVGSLIVQLLFRVRRRAAGLYFG